MKRSVTTVASLVAVGLLTAATYLTITYDPTTGTGFVGKGDVQLVLGLNNAKIQAAAASLNFTQQTTEIVQQGCYTNANEERGAICPWTFVRQFLAA